ncbi:MAG: UPF0058 family protein [Candidatus Nanohaloarchaea archaeon]
MKKQELIHLHGLVAEIDAYLGEEVEGYTPGSDRYDALPVRPTAIHRSKAMHKAGVYAKTIGIVETLRATGNYREPDYRRGARRRRERAGIDRGEDAEELVQVVDDALEQTDADSENLAAD